MKIRMLLLTAALIAVSAQIGAAQRNGLTFTGSILMYGSGFNTRTVTRTFTLRIDRLTTDAEASDLLGVLRSGGQDDLLRAISKNDLGSLSVGGSVARRINAVRVDDVDGKKRVRVVFERWMNFSELRGGYRSTDYPFGYIEIVIDPRSGKGDGTYIAAAKIRFRASKEQVEIEDFGTFPGRLMNVKMTGGLKL